MLGRIALLIAMAALTACAAQRVYPVAVSVPTTSVGIKVTGRNATVPVAGLAPLMVELDPTPPMAVMVEAYLRDALVDVPTASQMTCRLVDASMQVANNYTSGAVAMDITLECDGGGAPRSFHERYSSPWPVGFGGVDFRAALPEATRATCKLLAQDIRSALRR